LSVLSIVLILIISLLISNVISHYIPSVPTALTQILFGMLMALASNNISIDLKTEWFMLLFIAPLLYNEGVHFPNEELWKMKAPIFGNAIILVSLTTIGGGYFIEWLVPEIPLAAAFALAAILAPTDPVAVNGIITRVHIPERIISLVRGESLINDASGLIAFDYAIRAAATGYFVAKTAAVDFIYVFSIGAAAGLIIGLIILWLRHHLHKQGITDVTFYSLLSIISPFMIYLVAEELLHASGVIAVVVAGVIHSLMEEHFEVTAAAEKLLTANLWSVLTFVLNGVVFILLGLSIPASMIQVIQDPNIKNWHVILFAILIGIVILGIRFLWSFLSSGFTYLSGKGHEKPGLKTCLITAVAGVRGTVTMVGVLSIPYTLSGGIAFPGRHLIIFLAAAVILFTLLLATILLPILGEKKEEYDTSAEDRELIQAKKRILLVAINGFKQEKHKDNESVVYELIKEYRMMFRKLNVEHDYKDSSDYLRKVTDIRLFALNAERRVIEEMYFKNLISEDNFEMFDKSMNYKEEALLNTPGADLKYIFGKIRRRIHYMRSRNAGKQIDKMGIGKYIQLKAYRAAITSMQELARESEHPSIIQTVIFDYDRAIEQLKSTKAEFNEKKEEMREKLRIKIIDLERIEINRMFEVGEISYEQAKELRKFVNHIETIALYE
jgi:CPA1 family monovalent cation:H+ antiporter